MNDKQPQDNTLKIKINGVQKSIDLLEGMVDLFQRRAQELKLDHKPVDKAIEASVQNELLEIKKKVDKLNH